MAQCIYLSWRKELVSLFTILSLLGGQTIHGIGKREAGRNGRGQRVVFCEEVRRRQGIEAETLDLPHGRVGPCLETEWDVVCCACRVTEGGLAVPNPTFLGVENLPGLFLLLCAFSWSQGEMVAHVLLLLLLAR